MLCVAGEPSLNEVLRDPIIRAVMARDEVKEHDLRRLVEDIIQAYEAPDDEPMSFS